MKTRFSDAARLSQTATLSLSKSIYRVGEAVLAMMMECKLNELSHQFQSLAGILKTTIGPPYCLECNRP